MLKNEIDMSFNYETVTYGDIKDGQGKEPTEKFLNVLNKIKKGERSLENAWNRAYNEGKPHKAMWFNMVVAYDDLICPTIVDHNAMWDYTEKRNLSDRSIANASTFPQDYDFGDNKAPYICGMSVPPLMMKRVVDRLIESGIYDYEKESENENT